MFVRISKVISDMYRSPDNYDLMKNYTEGEVKEIAAMLFENLKDRLQNEEEIIVSGFGSFRISRPASKEKTIRNPIHQDEPMVVKVHPKVRFESHFKIGDDDEV